MNKGILCIIYVSEAMNAGTIERLKTVAGAALLHTFVDVTYNRTGFYLSTNDNILRTAANFANVAYSLVDYSTHIGTHPTLGSVDNICFSPLGEETIDTVAHTARDFGELLAEQEDIPVYLYGAASPVQSTLKDIRRGLGYFDSNLAATKLPTTNSVTSTSSKPIPDYGSVERLSPKKGVSCIGGVPLILNFNMRFRPEDARAEVIKVTKHVRAPDVEALTLPHEGGAFEVACNLRNCRTGTTTDQVLLRAQEKSAELGLVVEHAYTTGPTEAELLLKLPTSKG